MAAPDVHCPFLNRSDDRCSAHFSIDRLNHTFRHCFGVYQSCPVYLELLVERRTRRIAETVRRGPVCDSSMKRADVQGAPVQLTISRLHAQCPLPELRAFLVHLASEARAGG